jgi:serine/threonine-protein kinase PRP4
MQLASLDETEDERRIREQRERRKALAEKLEAQKKAQSGTLAPSSSVPATNPASAVAAAPTPAVAQDPPRPTPPPAKPVEDEAIDIFDPRFDEVDKRAAEGKLEMQLQTVRRESDTTDDTEGYYAFRIGEVLNKRYQVLGFYGQGVFGNVLKAIDLEQPDKPEVAIKLLRNNEVMKRSGRKEMKILKLLTEADPDNKYHVVRLLGSFEDRDHLCLVLEAMDLNLRQILKKYGNNQGINISAARIYAFKLLKALNHLKRNNIVHGDIKPDNCLVGAQDRTVIKLGDLGSAFETNEAELTPYLVSRYYRAPEIILGMHPLGFALDMFSLGTTLFELCTGQFLLPSRNNNHHLKLLMDIKGACPRKMLQQCQLRHLHFDEDGNFLERYHEAASGKELVRKIQIAKPTRNLAKEIMSSYGSVISTDDEKRMVTQMADLIDQCCTVDPRKRITPELALKHPLFAAATGVPAPAPAPLAPVAPVPTATATAATVAPTAPTPVVPAPTAAPQ